MALPHLDLWLRDLVDHDAGNSWHADRGDANESPRPPAASIGAADAQLVADIRDGNEAAFVELYKRYALPLAQFALQLVHDPLLAEDIAAHVLSGVWLRRDYWTVRDGIDAYLFGAVRNRVITLRHAEARHTRVERALAAEERSPTTGESPVSPDASVEANEWSERLQAAMWALPERYQLVASLRWKQGFEYDQIARLLGVSDVTARQLVSRTLRALRELLEV